MPFPTLVVFPQAQVGTRWADAEMEEMVIAALDQTMARFRVDAAQVYLHGYSMGGSGIYRIAYKWPSRFAAIAVVVCGPRDSGGPQSRRTEEIDQ